MKKASGGCRRPAGDRRGDLRGGVSNSIGAWLSPIAYHHYLIGQWQDQEGAREWVPPRTFGRSLLVVRPNARPRLQLANRHQAFEWLP